MEIVFDLWGATRFVRLARKGGLFCLVSPGENPGPLIRLIMNRREYLKKSAFAATAVGCGLGRPAHGYMGPKGGSLEDALELLELWAKQPESSLKLYSAIYQALAKSPKTSFAEVAGDDRVQALCSELEVLHLGGPMLGCVSSDGVKVWVRTTKPAEVEVRVNSEGGIKVFGPVKSSLASDLTAVVSVTGLPSGSENPYEVLVNGRAIPIPERAVIRTVPEAEADETRIAFGTCQHRWGLAHGKLSSVVAKRKPAAMLMYGDVAVQDRRNDLGMHRADYALRDFHPSWREIVCSIPVYTSWDDHDYFDNDLWGVPQGYKDEDRRGVRKVFTQAWNNPYYGLGDEGGGIFQHTRIGPCDLIMTDNRYFRTREGKHCFLGPEQMAWLEKTLLSCTAPFIIISCGTMWSDYVSGGKDSWGKFDPDGREQIFRLIEKHRIGGVLLVSGDRHGARGFRIPRPSGFEFYEFEPASLGGRSGPPAQKQEWDTQLFGFSDQFAFGEFTFDTRADDPTVTFRLIDEDEKELYSLKLTRSQLTPS